MSSHLSRSEKGRFHICLYFSSLSQLSFPVYLLQDEGGFDVCAYLAFSSAVMPSYFSLSEKGVVLTCVCSWLSLCHVILLIAI